MKNAIILHGVCDEEEFFNSDLPSPTNAHWLPWLKAELETAGYICHTPELPMPYEPSYADWKKTFETLPVNLETVLIGHSAGGGFLLRWLSDNNTRVKKLVLVAPWLDPNRMHGDFLQGPLGTNLAERVDEMHMFIADNEDVDGVHETVERVTATYPKTHLKHFATHGHFCYNDMGTTHFPELLQVVL